MKKRNIARFVAFMSAMLICLSTGLTLFAEGVDTLELPSASEPASQTASDGNALARSELGQKILDFKNSDEVEIKKLFGVAGLEASYDSDENKVVYSDKIAYSNDTSQYKMYLCGYISSLGTIEGKYGVYNKDSDKVMYFVDIKDGYTVLKELSDSESYTFPSKFASGDLKSVFSEDFVKSSYIFIQDTNDNILFTCKYEDFPKYVKTTSDPIKNDSEFKISVEPIEKEGSPITDVKLSVSFTVKTPSSGYNENYLKYVLGEKCIDKLQSITIINKASSKKEHLYVFPKDKRVDIGDWTSTFKPSGNGTYIFRFETLLGEKLDYEVVIDCLKPGSNNINTNIVIPAEELEAATVSFSGMPNEAYTNDSVTLKMSTNKKCKMSFNGSYLANNEYATSAEFTVTRNGIYSYTAINERGVATNGTFEVTFFKDRVEDAINDPLQMDLISAKTDSNLSQTGLYQTWLIILAVILCSVGILLIVNQKYHFLDKFIRRFKHESN